MFTQGYPVLSEKLRHKIKLKKYLSYRTREQAGNQWDRDAAGSQQGGDKALFYEEFMDEFSWLWAFKEVLQRLNVRRRTWRMPPLEATTNGAQERRHAYRKDLFIICWQLLVDEDIQCQKTGYDISYTKAAIFEITEEYLARETAALRDDFVNSWGGCTWMSEDDKWQTIEHLEDLEWLWSVKQILIKHKAELGKKRKGRDKKHG